jgi:hypothetical protein
MSDCRTGTYEGNVYEIGKDYLFSLNELDWTYAKLTAFSGWCSKPFCTFDREWSYIKEIPASRTMGTITPAPIELVDGNAYMFDYHENRKAIVGVYSQGEESFLTCMGILRPWNVTNIRLMTVEKR